MGYLVPEKLLRLVGNMPTSLETAKCQAALCTHVTAQRCAADAHGWALLCEFIRYNIFRRSWARTNGREVREIKGLGGVRNAHNTLPTSFLPIATCCTWEDAGFKNKTKVPKTIKKGVRRALRVRMFLDEVYPFHFRQTGNPWS